MDSQTLRAQALSAVKAGDGETLEGLLLEELDPSDVLFLALETKDPSLRARVLHAPSRWPAGFKPILSDDEPALLEARKAGAALEERLTGVLNGWTAVHVAAALGSTACLRRLLEWSVPRDGADALALAHHYGQQGAARILEGQGST